MNKSEWRRGLRERRKLLGLCRDCGGASGGRLRCDECMRKEVDRKAATRLRKTESAKFLRGVEVADMRMMKQWAEKCKVEIEPENLITESELFNGYVAVTRNGTISLRKIGRVAIGESTTHVSLEFDLAQQICVVSPGREMDRKIMRHANRTTQISAAPITSAMGLKLPLAGPLRIRAQFEVGYILIYYGDFEYEEHTP